jgi:hypothetical protein
MDADDSDEMEMVDDAAAREELEPDEEEWGNDDNDEANDDDDDDDDDDDGVNENLDDDDEMVMVRAERRFTLRSGLNSGLASSLLSLSLSALHRHAGPRHLRSSCSCCDLGLVALLKSSLPTEAESGALPLVAWATATPRLPYQLPLLNEGCVPLGSVWFNGCLMLVCAYEFFGNA